MGNGKSEVPPKRADSQREHGALLERPSRNTKERTVTVRDRGSRYTRTGKRAYRLVKDTAKKNRRREKRPDDVNLEAQRKGHAAKVLDLKRRGKKRTKLTALKASTGVKQVSWWIEDLTGMHAQHVADLIDADAVRRRYRSTLRKTYGIGARSLNSAVSKYMCGQGDLDKRSLWALRIKAQRAYLSALGNSVQKESSRVFERYKEDHREAQVHIDESLKSIMVSLKTPANVKAFTGCLGTFVDPMHWKTEAVKKEMNFNENEVESTQLQLVKLDLLRTALEVQEEGFREGGASPSEMIRNVTQLAKLPESEAS